MARFPGGSALVAMLLCIATGGTASAQGGWRQWDVVLRRGAPLVANPLGAPDSMHISRSVGGFDGSDTTNIPRWRIDYLAARHRPVLSADSTRPGAPVGRACEDALIYWDGRKTTGHVTLTDIRWSEGTVRQNGTEVSLAEVAYIKFGTPRHLLCRRSG